MHVMTIENASAIPSIMEINVKTAKKKTLQIVPLENVRMGFTILLLRDVFPAVALD